MKTFQQYDQENPHIWELYKAYAFKIIQSGRKHIGSKCIFELIRMEENFASTGNYKICNNFTPYYARKFVLNYPQFGSYFTLKPLRK